MESILTSIKKLLGIVEDYEHFDIDIILHINSAFSILTQLGVGPDEGFAIRDKSSTWDQFLPPGKKLEFVKSYVGLRVRVLFDPPNNPTMMESMNRMISEFEWRILHATI